MNQSDHDQDRCQHVFADNRRCLMSITDGPERLCLHHLQQSRGAQASEHAAADLFGSMGDFSSVVEINRALGKIFKLLAANRITPRSAAVLAYICQLSIITLPAMEHLTRGAGQAGDTQIAPALDKLVADLLQQQVLKPVSGDGASPQQGLQQEPEIVPKVQAPMAQDDSAAPLQLEPRPQPEKEQDTRALLQPEPQAEPHLEEDTPAPLLETQPQADPLPGLHPDSRMQQAAPAAEIAASPENPGNSSANDTQLLSTFENPDPATLQASEPAASPNPVNHAASPQPPVFCDQFGKSQAVLGLRTG